MGGRDGRCSRGMGVQSSGAARRPSVIHAGGGAHLNAAGSRRLARHGRHLLVVCSASKW